MTGNQKNRFQWIDILKGIGIICVIMGHSMHSARWVFSFHMPLFFIVGGFLFHKNSFCKHFTKTIIRIVVPHIFYLFILYSLCRYPPTRWCMIWGGEYLTGVFSVFWFSPVYFFSIIILWGIANISWGIAKSNYVYLCFALFFYVLSFNLPDVPRLHMQDIRVVPMALCYMLIGRLFYNFRTLFDFSKIRICHLLCILMIFICIVLCTDIQIDMKYADYGIPGLSLISSVFLTFCLAICSMYIAKQNAGLTRCLSFLGKNTLTYMYIHQYVSIEFVFHLFPQNEPFLLIEIIRFVLTFFFTFAISYIILYFKSFVNYAFFFKSYRKN